MPQMIQMRAVVAFDRNGRHLKVGDIFHAYPIEAASLNFNKKAVFDRGPQVAPAPSYGTRSMTATTPGTPVPPPPSAPAEEQREQSATAPSQTAEAESTQTTEGGRRRAGRSQQYGNRAMQRNGTTNSEG